MTEQKLVSAQQISSHKTADDCWVVVDNQVWDVTDFLEEHPGGSTGKGSTRCMKKSAANITSQ
jgi:L-lactate dehydrogenase (cytochrome)